MAVKRRQYLVKKGLQFRYIGVILITVFFISAICILTTYYNLLLLLGEKLADVYPQGRLVVTLRNVNMMVLYRIVFLLPFVGVAGLFLSHKIAGPLVRIERALKNIGDGNFDVFVKLRRGDELTDLASAVNEMAEKLKKRMSITEKSRPA